MTDDRDRDDPKDLKGAAALDEMSVRLGGLLGALRDTVGSLADAAKAAAERAETEGRASDAAPGGGSDGMRVHDVEIETPQGPITARAGFSMRVGGLVGGGEARADGDASDFSAEPFRPKSQAQSPEPPSAPSARACLTEVFDEADAWVLTAELPGVSEAQLSVAIEDGALALETRGDRRYAHREPLPEGLRTDALSTRLANGILEIRVPKAAADPTAEETGASTETEQ